MIKDKFHMIYKKAIIMACGIVLIVFWALLINVESENKQVTETTLTIAVLQDTRISNLDNNYYKEWLEKQTGYRIQFEYISAGYEQEYLNAMLTTSHSTIDAVFLPENQELLSEEQFQSYVTDGYIMDITDYMENDSNLAKVVKKYGSQQEKMTYFPNIDTSRKAQNMQVLWINMGWLKKLNLQVPRTSEELMTVLQAFKKQDPNGNGKQDELPLISCEEDTSLCSYYYLLNAYTYYNPRTGGVYQDTHNDIVYAPMDENFREGVKYASSLYLSGELSDACFDFSRRQLKEIVNAPEDLVGAFTSQSIADVVYPNCSDILARYIQVAPLTNNGIEGNAVKVDYQWNIGGYIPSNSSHPKEAFALMDLMLSEEASLIAEFGQGNVDWKFSEEGDLSTYGSKAKITTLRYLGDSIQDKNLAGMGPHVLAEEYANGVTWNGNNSLVEYIDARAVKSYEPYYNEVSVQSNVNDAVPMECQRQLQAYASEMIRQFVTGEQSVNEDKVWKSFLSEYRKIAGLEGK